MGSSCVAAIDEGIVQGFVRSYSVATTFEKYLQCMEKILESKVTAELAASLTGHCGHHGRCPFDAFIVFPTKLVVVIDCT